MLKVTTPFPQNIAFKHISNRKKEVSNKYKSSFALLEALDDSMFWNWVSSPYPPHPHF